MSDEIILNLSFNNQTVTDLTGNWTLDATPNATYEQIAGRDGYSIVEGSLGRCIVLNAVDQNVRYDEYTVDFDMFVKSTYTSNYYLYYVYYLWSRKDPTIVGSFGGKIGEVLSISPEIGHSSPVGVTSYSPIGRWVHVTITSGPTGVGNLYHTAVYVDGVKLTERTDSGSVYGGNPFGISQRIIPCARDPGVFLMPNGPGVCLNTYKIVAGIHAPDQKPAISLPNLSRVFQNFCTWISSQLSAVAKSGSYNDLSDKPTISTVNDGTLTIQKNGTNVATFTANQSTNATANITVPTAVSELANDSGYLTSSSNLDASKLTSGTVDIARLPQGALERLVKVANEAARYALTTADVQLGDTVQQLDTGIMYVVTDDAHLDSAAGYTEYTAGTAASVPWSGVTGKPTFAAVATSGAYSDLMGTPTIPTVNDATLTIQKNGTTVGTFSANQATDETIDLAVPTKTSDLTNDSGFITSDTTKIPLAGSNQISGSLVPSTDGTVNLGGTSYQWNNAYIKSLTINGVACGDILTHNVSEFVDVTSNQIIGGEKTFSNLRTYFGRDISFYSRVKYGKNSNPVSTSYQYLVFSGNIISDGPTNQWDAGCIEQVVNTNGSSRARWRIQDTAENYVGFELWVDGNDKQVRPMNQNTTILGEPNRRWKDCYTNAINGLNPGALSLPGTFVNVDTTNWVLDGTSNHFVPTSDGWLGIQAIDTVYDQMHYVFIGRTGGGNTYYQQNLAVTVNALWDSKYHGCIFIPVVKGFNYDIRCICSTIVTTFYPCQGNV